MKTRGSLDWFDLELGQDLAADLELSLELTIGLTSCQISEADFCRQVSEADFCLHFAMEAGLSFELDFEHSEAAMEVYFGCQLDQGLDLVLAMKLGFDCQEIEVDFSMFEAGFSHHCEFEFEAEQPKVDSERLEVGFQADCFEADQLDLDHRLEAGLGLEVALEAELALCTGQ